MATSQAPFERGFTKLQSHKMFTRIRKFYRIPWNNGLGYLDWQINACIN